MPWLLNCIYAVLIAVFSPMLVRRMIREGKYRDGWPAKFLGSLPPRTSDRPCIWFHAVSVGEVLQLQAVVAQMRAARPDMEIVVTTTTSTGYDVARQKFAGDHVCYFPLDFSWAVRRALDRIRPAAIVLVELELWPNFVRESHRRGIPIVLVNGRISEKSHRGYRRIRPFVGSLLRRLSVIAVQNDLYGGRLLDLGAPPERMIVTGSIKFDGVQTDRNNARTQALREALGLQRSETVFIAGSTQDPEEEYAVDAYLALRPRFPNLRLIVVPRHKERFDDVADAITRRGLPLLRRSTGQLQPGREAGMPPILLLDTLGELSACWGLADVAFVGGSLTQRGGQNMIEPAAYGAAVLFGPNTKNFRDVVDVLLAGAAARVVHDAADLQNTVEQFLADPETARALGRVAQRLVLAQQGATARTIEKILEVLPAAATQQVRSAA